MAVGEHDNRPQNYNDAPVASMKSGYVVYVLGPIHRETFFGGVWAVTEIYPDRHFVSKVR